MFKILGGCVKNPEQVTIYTTMIDHFLMMSKYY